MSSMVLDAAPHTSSSATRVEDVVPSLCKLAATTLARDMLTRTQESRPRMSLDGLPGELSKVVWKELRALFKRHERSVMCADMFPFVAACWPIGELDVSDAARWVTNASLKALPSVRSLRSVRLTACRFIGDDWGGIWPRSIQCS